MEEYKNIKIKSRIEQLENLVRIFEQDWRDEREDKLILYNAIDRAMGEINIIVLEWDNYDSSCAYKSLIDILQQAMHKVDPRWVSK